MIRRGKIQFAVHHVITNQKMFIFRLCLLAFYVANDMEKQKRETYNEL